MNVLHRFSEPPSGAELERLLAESEAVLLTRIRETSRPRRRKRTWLAGFSIAIAVGAGTAVATTGWNPLSGITADGRSYGPVAEGRDPVLKPDTSNVDLFRVVGDGGVVGWADRKEWAEKFGPGSTDPAEVAATIEQPVVIPLYAADGVTRVGTLTIRPCGDGQRVSGDVTCPK